MVYIKFGIVFELFVYKIYGDSDGAFLCGTEILNSRLNEMDFRYRSCANPATKKYQNWDEKFFCKKLFDVT